jgi:hypothetical protein
MIAEAREVHLSRKDRKVLEAHCLHFARHVGYGGAPNAHHLGEKLLRQKNGVALCTVTGL